MSTDDPADLDRQATVDRLLDDPALWAEVPRGLRAQVVAAATDPTADAPPEPEGDLGDLPREPRHTARRVDRAVAYRRRPVVLAAAAAVVVVCLGVAGGVRLLADDPTATLDVALAGTDEAPAARATARLSDEPAGVRVVLDVSGLEPAPDGTFYEAWVVGDAGKVSAGSFHLRGDQATIELWLGVDTREYDAVTITRQPVAGGSLADGVVVLRGELPRQR